MPVIWKDDPGNYLFSASNMSRQLGLRPGMGTPRFLTQNSGKDGVTIAAGTIIPLLSGSTWKTYFFPAVTDITTLDTGALSNGKDYCVYLCDDGGDNGVLLISLNATAPSGYTTTNSRKIGGFHTLCAAVGTITNHPLSGYLANQVLPDSVWDLTHRPKNASPNGMAYSQALDLWLDIYMMSGTGLSSGSVFNATITDTRNQMDFVDDLAAVGKRLLWDAEFGVAAAGSNEETNIAGSADPVTTGGHSDTNGRRMISNIGLEDCCGAMWQWLSDNAFYPPGGTAGGYWGNLPGEKGSIFTTFTADPGSSEVTPSVTSGMTQLLAGGAWADGTNAGSRCRSATNSRWSTHSTFGARGCARSQ